MKQRVFVFAMCAAAVAGCTAQSAEKTDLGDPELPAADAPQDQFSRAVRLQGIVHFGESVAGTYAATGYSGWTFSGARGARVVLDLVGHGSDPVLYVYGPQVGSDFRRAARVARNDDFGGSLDSHVEVRLPADGTYVALAREYWGEPGDITLTLGCSGGECRPECRAGDVCPTGSLCLRVYCIRAPCPSYCEPAPVERPCGSRGLASCDAGSYCDFPATANCGRSDAPGVCRLEPTACTRELRQVCGCDGATYGNACSAHAAGVSVEHDGACDTTCDPVECGPRLGLANTLCPDGVTVAGPGDCVRNATGACGWEIIACPEAQACGSRGLGPCEDGQFCNYPERAICGRADAPGVCAPIPAACTSDWSPVCGCDGRTYGNACAAHAAGVSAERTGECAATCRVGGCSGQLCVGPSDSGISTCEWRASYACYRSATCELQPSGACGWTPTPELQACLSSPPPL